MKYRKFKADYIFNGSKMLHNQVLIANSRGKIINIINENEAGENVKVFRGILSPGFVNTHCHLELSHLKNVIHRKIGLVDFVATVVSKKDFSQNEINAAIEKAEMEMVNAGIVAVGDICNNSLSILQKEKKNLCYYNFIEISGWNPDVAESRFEKSKKYYQEFIQKKMLAALVPHAPYSVSDLLWGKIAPFFSQKVVTIHSQETKDEDEFFVKGSGKFLNMYKMMNIDNSFYQPKKIRSVQTYFKKFSKAASVILVHNTFTKKEDINYINQTKSSNQVVSFCLCPNANLYIENALPPVNLLLKNNCNIVVGTDSLASNQNLNVLEELKTISKNFPGVKTEVLLKWATINGARALQMDDKLGGFEKGKTPGIVLIENIINKKLVATSSSRKIL